MRISEERHKEKIKTFTYILYNDPVIIISSENKYEWDDWIKYEWESLINPFIGFWINRKEKISFLSLVVGYLMHEWMLCGI